MGIGMQIIYLGLPGNASLEAEAAVQLLRLQPFSAAFSDCRLEIEQVGQTPELEVARFQAEQAGKLARYYEDAMELARRITEWSKGLTGNHHFIVCSGGSGGRSGRVEMGRSD